MKQTAPGGSKHGSHAEKGRRVTLLFLQCKNSDHKAPLNLLSDIKHHCLVVSDRFFRIFQVYQVKATYASKTIEAMTTFIKSFRFP